MPQHLRYDLQFPVTVMDVVLMGRLGGGGLGGAVRLARSGPTARPPCESLDRGGMAEHAPAAACPICPADSSSACSLPGHWRAEPELLLLDEPTANVDMRRIETRLLEVLADLGRG